MKRIIVGIIGEGSHKKDFVELCRSNGFHVMKILDKVKELASYIFNKDLNADLDAETLNSIRDRGYKVNKMYWVNLLLSSMSNDYKCVVIEDMREEDIIQGVIEIFDMNEMSQSDMDKKFKQLFKK